jgi:hypothetical protein
MAGECKLDTKMRFTFFLLTIFLSACHGIWVKPTTVEQRIYLKSIEFVKSKYKSEDFATLKKNCLSLTNVVKKSSYHVINISPRRIDNNLNYVLCDILNKKYLFEENCVHLLGNNLSAKVKSIEDSISTVINNQNRFDRSDTSHEYIKKLASDNEEGIVVFFSSVFQNTVSIEVKSFCVSYIEETKWHGSSQMYHLVFTKEGSLTEVYSGIKHYD